MNYNDFQTTSLSLEEFGILASITACFLSVITLVIVLFNVSSVEKIDKQLDRIEHLIIDEKIKERDKFFFQDSVNLENSNKFFYEY